LPWKKEKKKKDGIRPIEGLCRSGRGKKRKGMRKPGKKEFPAILERSVGRWEKTGRIADAKTRYYGGGKKRGERNAFQQGRTAIQSPCAEKKREKMMFRIG